MAESYLALSLPANGPNPSAEFQQQNGKPVGCQVLRSL